MRMFVYNDREENDPKGGSLCNPEIAWHSDKTEEAEEGCLSIPGTYFPVVRWSAVQVRAQDVSGAQVEHEAEGFLARIFQHEIDHLDGMLFIDRLAPELRKQAKRALLDQDFGMAPPAKARRAL